MLKPKGSFSWKNCNNPEERFWRRVEKTETCWLWTGTKVSKGYAAFYCGPNTCVLASRWIAERSLPDWDADKHVLHRCDNPLCVNPEHLFMGTNHENILDRIAKGRSNYVTGQEHGRSKLTEEQVREIRLLAAKGWGDARIAHSMPLRITPQAVRLIRLRETWKRVV